MKCKACGNDALFTVVTRRFHDVECSQGKMVQGILDDETLMVDETLCGKCKSKDVDFPENERDDIWHIV